MKKVILCAQLIFAMFYLNYGYAQTLSNLAIQKNEYFDFIKHLSADVGSVGNALTYHYPSLLFSGIITKDLQSNQNSFSVIDKLDLNHNPVH